MGRVDEVEAAVPRRKLPEFGPGDTVRVEIEVVEGEKRRMQAFQGTVLQRRGSGPRETFTVRKVSAGVGVERIFPAHAPGIVSVSVVQKGSVRRARLTYLRGRKGRAAQVKRHQDQTGLRRGAVEEAEPEVPEVEVAAVAAEESGSKS
jgi:large subunit ribosomal protein L19